MPTPWVVSTVALWVIVLLETGLLLLLLRALGEIKQQGILRRNGPDLGDKAPPFIASDRDGNLVKLDDYQGYRRILAFISPGCSACSGAVDALNSFLEEKPSLRVLIVGGSDSQSNFAYALEHQIKIPILIADSNLNSNIYSVHAFPFGFLIDEKGTIRAKGVFNEIEDLQQWWNTTFVTVSASSSV